MRVGWVPRNVFPCQRDGAGQETVRLDFVALSAVRDGIGWQAIDRLLFGSPWLGVYGWCLVFENSIVCT